MKYNSVPSRAEEISDGTDELFGSEDEDGKDKEKKKDTTTPKGRPKAPAGTKSFSLEDVLNKKKNVQEAGKDNLFSTGVDSDAVASFADILLSVEDALHLQEAAGQMSVGELPSFSRALRRDLFNHVQQFYCSIREDCTDAEIVETLLVNTSLPCVSPTRARLQLLE